MAVDIVRYIDVERDEILEAVVSSIVPRVGEAVTIGSYFHEILSVSHLVSERLDDFLDRDDKVHIAVVDVERIKLEDSPP